MKSKLHEVLLSNNRYVLGFTDFDECEDFTRIMKIIETIIKPVQCDWGGMEDMHGFFEKDDLYIEVEFNSMMGNFLVFKGDKTEVNLRKIRQWAQSILDNLLLDIK